MNVMNNEIAEFDNFAMLSNSLSNEYGDDSFIWRGSPFEWIHLQPSRTKGAIGEKLVEGWCSLKGFEVKKSPHSDADRIINGHRVEIKYSNLWKDGRSYTFQQLRDQEYDFYFLLGISPRDVHAWFIPKNEIMSGDFKMGVTYQHAGRRGHDTRWLRIDATCPPDWMHEYGGTLSKTVDVIKQMGRGCY